MIEFADIQTTVVVLLAICSAVGVIWQTHRIVNEARQPQEDRLKRLERVETHLSDDNERLKDLEEASRLNLRAQLVIIQHLTTGNHTEQLEKVQDKIQLYLINK